jgi:hypothetical protein
MRQSSNELAGLELILRPQDFLRQWQRCGQTADWIANYLVHDIEPSGRSDAKNVLSTVINELLENAIKFSSDDPEDVKVAVRHRGSFISIETRNVTSAARARLLEKTLEELDTATLDSLFARRVAGNDADAPGVGLLIIKRDYGARVDAVLTPRDDGASDVHLTVELDLAAVKSS